MKQAKRALIFKEGKCECVFGRCVMWYVCKNVRSCVRYVRLFVVWSSYLWEHQPHWHTSDNILTQATQTCQETSVQSPTVDWTLQNIDLQKINPGDLYLKQIDLYWDVIPISWLGLISWHDIFSVKHEHFDKFDIPINRWKIGAGRGQMTDTCSTHPHSASHIDHLVS